MNKANAAVHGHMKESSTTVARIVGFPATAHVKSKKPVISEKIHLWESSFHAERGCLNCGLGPKSPPPLANH